MSGRPRPPHYDAPRDDSLSHYLRGRPSDRLHTLGAEGLYLLYLDLKVAAIRAVEEQGVGE